MSSKKLEDFSEILLNTVSEKLGMDPKKLTDSEALILTVVSGFASIMAAHAEAIEKAANEIGAELTSLDAACAISRESAARNSRAITAELREIVDIFLGIRKILDERLPVIRSGRPQSSVEKKAFG